MRSCGELAGRSNGCWRFPPDQWKTPVEAPGIWAPFFSKRKGVGKRSERHRRIGRKRKTVAFLPVTSLNLLRARNLLLIAFDVALENRARPCRRIHFHPVRCQWVGPDQRSPAGSLLQ